MESGIPMSLIGANADTLAFNDWANERANGLLMVDEVSGLDAATLRAPVDNRPQRDGLIVHPFYDGGRVFMVTGRVLPTSLANGIIMHDRIRALTNSIKRADGRFTFTPTGQATRFLTVRLNDSVNILNDEALRTGSYDPTIIKRFEIPLVAGDPTVYGLTETDVTIPSGSSVAVINHGNANSYPVAEVNGPFSGFRLTNATTGFYIAMSGLSIAAGHSIEIVMRDETIYKDRNGANELFGLDFANSDFWYLAPGGNTIVFDNITGGDGSESVTLKTNDGWA